MSKANLQDLKWADKLTWADLDFSTEADTKSRDTIALLDGAKFRTVGGANGTVRAHKIGLVLAYDNGRSEPLTAAHGKTVEFGIPAEKMAALADTSATAAHAPSRSVEQILASCPPWSRRVVAQHLAPERLAAHDQSVKDARIAQLSAIGRVVSRKPEPAAKASANLREAPPAMSGREAREAQLREIGKAATGRR